MENEIIPFWETWWSVFLVNPLSAVFTAFVVAYVIIVLVRWLWDELRGK